MLTQMRKYAIFVLTILTMVSGSYVFAQSNNASITGEITDPHGAVVQGAQVRLVSKDTQQSSDYVSDANGYYSFRNVLPGTYQLTIAAPGNTPRKAFSYVSAIPFDKMCSSSSKPRLKASMSQPTLLR